MANGRHARGAEGHLDAQRDPGPQALEDRAAIDNAPAPAGRRRKISVEGGIPAPTAPEPNISADLAAETGEIAGTGRRRRAATPVDEPAAAPSGRRRRAPEAPDAAPRAEVPATPPIAFAARVAPATPVSAVPAAPAVSLAPAIQLAEVVEVAPRSHRRAAPKPAARRKVALPVSAPSGTALIAGAAAVAVAAVGAVGAADSGSDLGASSVEMSRASALGLTESASAVATPAAIEREQVRASRERARDALADRARAAAALKKKEAAAAKVLAAAKARAERLTLLAKSFRLPVSGYHLTAGFGEGGYRWSAGHTGLDFACSYGSPIRAVASGTVIFAGWDGSYGYKTIIRHADGTETWYAHQAQILIRRGAVAAGDVIGRVGMTGNTSGPHLHLEVRVNDNPINPLTWLRSKGLRP